MGWRNHVGNLSTVLNALSITDKGGNSLGQDRAFLQWVQTTLAIRKAGGSIYIIGNGASSAMACHFAADVQKNALIDTQVLTNPALITAYANDISYECVYSEPLKLKCRHQDMLIAISGSGQSANVVKGVIQALENEATVVTLSGMKPANQIRTLGHYNFYVPADTYGLVETAHATVMHYWVDLLIGDTHLAEEMDDAIDDQKQTQEG